MANELAQLVMTGMAKFRLEFFFLFFSCRLSCVCLWMSWFSSYRLFHVDAHFIFLLLASVSAFCCVIIWLEPPNRLPSCNSVFCLSEFLFLMRINAWASLVQWIRTGWLRECGSMVHGSSGRGRWWLNFGEFLEGFGGFWWILVNFLLSCVGTTCCHFFHLNG